MVKSFDPGGGSGTGALGPGGSRKRRGGGGGEIPGGARGFGFVRTGRRRARTRKRRTFLGKPPGKPRIGVVFGGAVQEHVKPPGGGGGGRSVKPGSCVCLATCLKASLGPRRIHF